LYDIEMHEPSEEFARCWQAAGRHFQTLAQGSPFSWLKASLTPPFLEHLSFRMGNHLFFIRIEDVEKQLEVPGTPTGVLRIAAECNGHACLMPMRRKAGDWTPDAPSWGLIDARSGESIDPVSFVSDEKIEMTDWELHDFAVQVVRDYITSKLGYKLMSWSGCPDIDPAIWFVGDQGPEWVVVRAVRYPEAEAALPNNIQEIADSCLKLSRTGQFASVSVANSEDAFDPAVPTLPLWRGHGMYVRFEGLVPAKVQ
jgi:hypothetical protein